LRYAESEVSLRADSRSFAGRLSTFRPRVSSLQSPVSSLIHPPPSEGIMSPKIALRDNCPTTKLTAHAGVRWCARCAVRTGCQESARNDLSPIKHQASPNSPLDPHPCNQTNIPQKKEGGQLKHMAPLALLAPFASECGQWALGGQESVTRKQEAFPFASLAPWREPPNPASSILSIIRHSDFALSPASAGGSCRCEP
jgi:hypothetical protein